jgi:hypothetical protein
LYRIEISILAPCPDGNLLAINDAPGWQPDNQEHLAAWFKNQIKHQGLQLRRVASYLHGWADFHPNQLEPLSRLLPLDILAARFFRADIGRDDKSLARTAKAIATAVSGECEKQAPFAGEHSLPWFLSRQESQKFIRSLEVLVERSRLAVMTKDKTHACAIWRSLFGDRFPMAGAAQRRFGRGNHSGQQGGRYSDSRKRN